MEKNDCDRKNERDESVLSRRSFMGRTGKLIAAGALGHFLMVGRGEVGASEAKRNSEEGTQLMKDCTKCVSCQKCVSCEKCVACEVSCDSCYECQKCDQPEKE